MLTTRYISKNKTLCNKIYKSATITEIDILTTINRRLYNTTFWSSCSLYNNKSTLIQHNNMSINTLQSQIHNTSNNNQQSQSQKPLVIFVLGGPGAGKGTQCTNIQKNYNYIHLSAGDLLREERNNPNSQNGKLIDEYIRNGQIVPVEITVQLLKNAMQYNIDNKQIYRFLIDGFPRNQDNLDGWYRVIGDYARVQNVLFFDCSEQTMENRLLQRGLTSGRTDDNADSIRKRFITYKESTKPIIDYFDKLGLVNKIDADQTVEQVFIQVKDCMEKLNSDSNN